MRLFALVTLLLAIVPAAHGNVLVVPVVAKTPGALGTNFTTDVTIRNMRESPQETWISYLPANQDNWEATNTVPPVFVTINAGATITLEDIVGTTFHTEGMGSVVIRGTRNGGSEDVEARLAAAYRIYTPVPGESDGGTMSQTSNAVDPEAQPAATVALATGLRQDASFRTNVGVFNRTYGERTFRITASGPDGSKTIDLTVPPFSMRQQPLPAGTLGPVSVRFELLNPDAAASFPTWFGYGSTVDNQTGDSWLQPAVPMP